MILKTREFLFLSKYNRKLFSITNVTDVLKIKELGNNRNIYGLYINSPKNKNALSKIFMQKFKENIEKINNSNEIRAVILMSETPGIFCAGADLKERQTMTENETENFVSDLRNTFQVFYDLKVPSICAIDGFALGGGLELAMSADIRICTKSSTLGLTECSLGIIPGAGGTQRLPRIVGTSKAKQLIFTSEKLNGDKALSLGLVDILVDKYEDLEIKALEIAEEIAKNGPLAIINAKKAINYGEEFDMKAGLDIEAFYYGKILKTEDRLEGIKAFLEKRDPIYKGK